MYFVKSKRKLGDQRKIINFKSKTSFLPLHRTSKIIQRPLRELISKLRQVNEEEIAKDKILNFINENTQTKA